MSDRYPCPVCRGSKEQVVGGACSINDQGITSVLTTVPCGDCGGTGRENYWLRDYRGFPIERQDRELYETIKAVVG